MINFKSIYNPILRKNFFGGLEKIRNLGKRKDDHDPTCDNVCIKDKVNSKEKEDCKEEKEEKDDECLEDEKLSESKVHMKSKTEWKRKKGEKGKKGEDEEDEEDKKEKKSSNVLTSIEIKVYFAENRGSNPGNKNF